MSAVVVGPALGDSGAPSARWAGCGRRPGSGSFIEAQNHGLFGRAEKAGESRTAQNSPIISVRLAMRSIWEGI